MDWNQQINQRTGCESNDEAINSTKNGLVLKSLKTETQISIDNQSNCNIKYGTVVITIVIESNFWCQHNKRILHAVCVP